MKFDKWQQEVIDLKGSATIRAGRQVGKSTTVGKRISNFMFDYAPCTQLITAPSQRQSSQLFIKTMGWLNARHIAALEEAGGYKEDVGLSMRRNEDARRIFEKEHGIFKEYPTKTQAVLKNGSICYALPAGKTGAYLRTFALDFLHIDEAAYVPDIVFTALNPMLAVSQKERGLGWKTFLSTPFGKGGFFYESHHSEDYKQFHVSSENCPRISKEFLAKEKKRLTRMEYAQEWLGEFVDEFHQYFPTKLIKDRMTFFRWNFKEHFNRALAYYEGIDLAGPGKDTSAFVINEMDGTKVRTVIAEEDDEKNTVKTRTKVENQNKAYNFKRIFVDSGGFGSAWTDDLKDRLGRKVIGLDNAKKTVDKFTERTGKIFKEDLYSNALFMMERGLIDIVDSMKLLRSLKSVTWEHTASGNLRIYGKNTHLAEAFVRACWCVKEKGLNIFLY